MARESASTVLELLTKPISFFTDANDWLAGMHAHERFSNQIKTTVFSDSHLRDIDKVSTDRTLRSGDILRVSRRFAGIVHYYHYGVYVGEGRVVHHVSSSEENVRSKNVIYETETSLFVLDSDEIEIFAFPASIDVGGVSHKVYSSFETVTRARSRVGCADYDVNDRNCEHFNVV